VQPRSPASVTAVRDQPDTVWGYHRKSLDAFLVSAVFLLQEIHALRAAELHEAVSQGAMLLTLELPVFPHAVLYQQSLSAAAVVAQAAGAPGAVSAAAGGGLAAAGAAGLASGVADIIRFQDPEVRTLPGPGRECKECLLVGGAGWDVCV
jgi:hypothetical protein